MTDVLAGVRVIEVADWGFVPSAATVLGDWGAEVVKIEHPRFGDPIRGLVTVGPDPRARRAGTSSSSTSDATSAASASTSRTPEGRALLAPAGRRRRRLPHQLPRRRARAAAHHLGRPARRQPAPHLRPRLRPGTPRARTPGAAATTASRSGPAAASPTASRPPASRRSSSDPPSATSSAAWRIAGGIAAALFQRERTGEGLEVDVSLLGTAMWVLSPDITASLMYGFMLPAAGDMPSAPNPLVGTYFCADGKGLVLMMLQAERFWPHFAATVGRPDLLERYPTPEARRDQAARHPRGARRALRHPAARRRGRTLLRASECIWGPFQTPLDLPDDPQVQANGYLLASPTADGAGARVRQPGPVRRRAARRAQRRRRTPARRPRRCCSSWAAAGTTSGAGRTPASSPDPHAAPVARCRPTPGTASRPATTRPTSSTCSSRSCPPTR